MDQNNNRSPCKKPDLIRKKRKPLMEKRRRARINASLEQLKKLVLDATRKDSARYSKLEKADILELTVRHLRDIQRTSMSCALSRNPHVLTQFNDGFVECSTEVDRYLSSSNGVSRDTHMRLLSHLSTLTQKGRIAAQLPPSPGGSCRLGLPNMSVFLQSGVGGDQVCNPQPIGIHSPTHSPPTATPLQILPGTVRSTPVSTSSPTSSSSTNLKEQLWSYHKLPMSPPSSPRDDLHENIIMHKAPMGLQCPHTLPPAMKEYISSCRPQEEHPFKTFPLVNERPDPSSRDHREHLMKPIKVEDQISMERLFRERQQVHDLSARGLQMFKGVDENVWRPW